MKGFLIALVILTSFFVTGFMSLVYAIEDGNFPVFPTVIEESITNEEIGIIKVKEERGQSVSRVREDRTDEGVTSNESVVTNELGVFSPWGTVKRALSDRAQRGEEGNASNGKDDGGLTASVLDSAGDLALWMVIILVVVGLTFVAYRHFTPAADRRRSI